MANPASPSEHRSIGPPWAEWIGVLAVILGAYLTASFAIHATQQYVFSLPISAEERASELECPEDELIEEGITLVVCEQMQADIETTLITTPEGFLSLQFWLGIAGLLFAAGSIYAGMALVDWRPWAPPVFIAVMAALILLELSGLVAAAESGPLIRKEYLWGYLLWLAIHISFASAVGAAWTDPDQRATE